MHGAGSGPWIFEAWRDAFEGVDVVAVDLLAGRDAAHASMGDYADDLVAQACSLSRPLGLCGWSMGGLVALMAESPLRPDYLIVMEPSAPAEVAGMHPDVVPRHGTFDPIEVYGDFPPGIASRPESEYARAERKRGISIARVSCPVLVVFSDEYRVERGESVADHLGGDRLHFSGFNHWDLVLDPQVRNEIAHRVEGAQL